MSALTDKFFRLVDCQPNDMARMIDYKEMLHRSNTYRVQLTFIKDSIFSVVVRRKYLIRMYIWTASHIPVSICQAINMNL